ncbi:NYN domain-containing protein, partial [Campylobacter coli]|nr:NYN domain-containing protein [Campylobacter coli]
LISKPCLALRLGYLDEKSATWIIKNKKKHKKLLSGKITIKDLSDNDYMYYAKQKGVDMKIGIDIATLALKKLVQKIVLISGDSDFVPASKLARTEGIIFTLDPMGNPIKENLEEHIDYLKTTLPYFKK